MPHFTNPLVPCVLFNSHSVIMAKLDPFIDIRQFLEQYSGLVAWLRGREKDGPLPERTGVLRVW